MPKSVPAKIERIPFIDFAGFSAADTARRQATVSELRAALESCGFLYLSNHGVAQSLIDAVFAQSRAFFSLPAEAKQKQSLRKRAARVVMKASACKLWMKSALAI